MVKKPESMVIEVIRVLILAGQHPDIQRISVTVAPEVADHLNNKKRHELAQIEDDGGMVVQVLDAKGVPPEHLVIECRDAEGREVKFPKT